MNKIQLAIVATLLIWGTCALRLGDHNHKAYDNAADYLQGLQSQQSKFEAQIDALEANVEKTISDASAQSDIAQKISILENGILNQQNEIFIASTSLIPVLVLKDQCTNITEADKTKLIQKCQTTVSDIKTLLAKLQTLPQDARVQEMTASANHQIYYLETIQKVLQENCTTTTILSPTVYQSNIYATNWITGNQTINDLVAVYVARSQQYDNITNCPLDRPFYSGNACINCTGSTPIFDMKSSVCTSCPTGTVFNSQEKVCKVVAPSAPNATNVAAGTTYVGPQPVSQPGDIVCPAETPFFNGTGCVACNGTTQVFNTSSLVCITCPSGSAYDNSTHNCVYKFNVSNPILNNETIGVIPNPGPYDVPCPASYPFYLNGTCHNVDCFDPNPYFNITSLLCTSCPSGTIYNATTHDCSPVSVPPTASNPVGVNNTIGQLGTSGNQCPLETPFYNGKICINCTAPTPLFNATSLTCTSCPAGSTYSVDTKSCVIVYNATNPTAVGNTIGTFPNTTQYDVVCPASNPIYINGTCHSVQCPADYPILNVSTLECVNCPAPSYYNATSHSCVTPTPVANVTLTPNASNPSATNTTIGNLTSPKPTDVLCPSTAPYFVNGSCTNCTAPTPLFNATSNQCTACPSGSVYSVDTHSCVIAFNVTNPSINNNTIGTFPNISQYDVPCPPEAPLFLNGTCHNAQCPPDFPYLNVSSLECVNCSAPSYYNVTSHSCVTPTPVTLTPNASNPSAANTTIGNLTSPKPTDVLCPSTAPYFVNGSCTNCTAPTPLFNATSNQCTACPSGSVYSVDTHSCNIIYNVTNPSVNNNTIGTFPNISQYDVPCPQSSPLFINGTCHSYACPPNAPILNATSLECVACPSGTTYNVASHSCSALAPNATNPSGANLAIGNVTSPAPTDIVCPSSNPYFVNGACINCTAPTPYFNVSSQSCTSCPSGTVYDENTHSCVVSQRYISNLASGNWVSSSPYKDLIENQEAIQNGTGLPCPSATPYFNGVSCISCPANTYFDLNQKKCISCPAGTTYSTVTYKCELNTDTYQTNPNTAPNLIYGDAPKKEIVDNYTAANQAGVLDCTSPTPYYNGIQCISCSDPKYPYFDLEIKDCVNCTGAYSVSSTNQCVDTVQGGLAPNLSAMAANAFGHHLKSLTEADVGNFRHRIVSKK